MGKLPNAVKKIASDELIGESLPRRSIIELCSDNRLYVERHFGVYEYSDVEIHIGAKACSIIGGNGGDGGNGIKMAARPGTDGGDGGDGGIAIRANSITIKVDSGYARTNLTLRGGNGGKGGNPGDGDGLAYGKGSPGDPGKDAAASNVTIKYS